MSAHTSASARRVAIVGGGYSGSAAAVQLVRASPVPLAITIVEPRPELGGGLAHSADDPDHRLTATPDLHLVDPADPGAFQRWCAEQRLAERDPSAVAEDGSLYARRKEFGAFVAQTVRAHAAWPTGSTIHHLKDFATEVLAGAGAIEIRTVKCHVVVADLMIVATGYTTPRLLVEFGAALHANAAVVAVPTDLERVRAIPRKARVLVLGSGLTALDILSTLIRVGHEGAITVISRRGLRPRSNPPRAPTAPNPLAGDPLYPIDAPVAPFIQAAGYPPTVRGLLRALRQHIDELEASGHTWYAAFDELRDVVWQVWPGLHALEKRRFLKRLRPWWDAHRFRAPPQNEAIVREAERQGRIRFQAARLRSVTQETDGQIRVHLLDRVMRNDQVLNVDAVINCTGLDSPAGVRDNPFLATLLRAGLVSADSSSLGFAVDDACRAIGTDGRAHDHIRVIGPPTIGAFGDPVGAMFIAAQIRRAIPNMLATLGAAHQRRSRVETPFR